MREVYLDYAAATPMAPEVIEAMLPFFSECFYNPSAPYARAREAKAAYEGARTRIARVLAARPGCITMTAGATEANNIAFSSVAGHVMCSAIEHESVLACVEHRGGTLIPVDSEGFVTAEAVRASLRPETELVSIGLANGEIGTIQPMRAIGAVVREERMRRLEQGNHTPLLLHSDATQAAGSVSLNVSGLGVDLMTLSAAKVYGPKQVGLLWHAEGVSLCPVLRGGGQESGVRSGTENVAGAVGFACALELCERMRVAETRRQATLAKLLRERLASTTDDVVFSGPHSAKLRLPGLVHASFGGVEARRLVVALEREGVSVGTGSACAASRMRSSHVLRAIGLDDRFVGGSLRLTIGRETSEDDVTYAAEAIARCVASERERTAGRR